MKIKPILPASSNDFNEDKDSKLLPSILMISLFWRSRYVRLDNGTAVIGEYSTERWLLDRTNFVRDFDKGSKRPLVMSNI